MICLFHHICNYNGILSLIVFFIVVYDYFCSYIFLICCRADFFATLPPAFLCPEDGGTVTAANESTHNDGATAFMLMSENTLKGIGAAPASQIIG